jgi:hypothetical protein
VSPLYRAPDGNFCAPNCKYNRKKVEMNSISKIVGTDIYTSFIGLDCQLFNGIFDNTDIELFNFIDTELLFFTEINIELALN